MTITPLFGPLRSGSDTTVQGPANAGRRGLASLAGLVRARAARLAALLRFPAAGPERHRP